jgi:hypothetical protein
MSANNPPLLKVLWQPAPKQNIEADIASRLDKLPNILQEIMDGLRRVSLAIHQPNIDEHIRARTMQDSRRQNSSNEKDRAFGLLLKVCLTHPRHIHIYIIFFRVWSGSMLFSAYVFRLMNQGNGRYQCTPSLKTLRIWAIL